MKKIITFIAFIVLLVSLSSCRSTSKSCGLAENESTNQINSQQTPDIVFEFVS